MEKAIVLLDFTCKPIFTIYVESEILDIDFFLTIKDSISCLEGNTYTEKHECNIYSDVPNIVKSIESKFKEKGINVLFTPFGWAKQCDIIFYIKPNKIANGREIGCKTFSVDWKEYYHYAISKKVESEIERRCFACKEKWFSNISDISANDKFYINGRFEYKFEKELLELAL